MYFNLFIKMKIILIFICCLIIINAHIYSATPKVTYNIDGRPLIYHLYMSLETGLGATDYLHLIWPQVIHASLDKTKVKAKLIIFANNLEVSSTYFSTDLSNSDSNYYVTFNYEMQPKSWYEVQIFPTQNPTIPSNKLVQLIARSSKDNDAIVYDSNLAFAYINVQNDLSLTGGVDDLILATSSTSSLNNKPATIYTIDIDITPKKSQAKGGNFTLELYYDNLIPAHSSSNLNLKDFSFVGLCQSKSAAIGQAAAVLNYCQISADLSTITFSLNSVVMNKKIKISTQIKNPLYKSTRGIRGYWVQFVSGIVQQNGKLVSGVSVNSIPINNLNSDRIYLLWGIEPNYHDTDNRIPQIPLFKAENSSSAIIPYNSFNIGFSFSVSSPIEGRYRVKITLQAQGILEGSLVHNFPAYENQKVYCHYETTQIFCENVGPFINTEFRYFISGKAFFNSNTAPTLNTFGDIAVVPVIYVNAVQLTGVSLYDNLNPGTVIPVKVGRSYLNLDVAKGYHMTNFFKIGNAQVVSMKDDKSLSSTATAMKQFFTTGTNNTVGVVPDLGTSQQLVFLLQTANSDIDAGMGNDYSIKLIYNNKVIGFEDEDSASSRGLDFVGYQTSGNWSISYSPCHQVGSIVCQKYNLNIPLKNKQIRVNTQQIRNNFGLYDFSCGTSYSISASCGGACVDECNMFRGWGNSNLGSSVMSMRRVTFKTDYYSSLYADENLLDFVIIFYQGSTIVSMGLINAYTIVGSKMVNIKAAYVNYFDYSNNNYNKGTRIPMMLRIAGGVLPKQSRKATVIGVFFDDNVQAKTFYTKKDTSYQIGCSTNNCLYYPNKNINLARNDNWHTNKRIQFYNIPPLQTQFNLLVPVSPNPSNHDLPKTLYIGFFDTSYTLSNVTGLLKTLSIYRLFGASVCQTVNGQINAINLLTRSNSLAGANGDLSSPDLTNSFISYGLNVTNIVSNPTNNTFSKGYTRTGLTYGTYFGAGVTITSLYYNIFSSSSLSFQSPPANTAKACVIFGYVYNEQVSGNQIRDKQWIYTAFCPIDSAIDLSISAGNINFGNPQYPNVFTNEFPLQSVLTYAYSDEKGNLLDYKHQKGIINAFQRTCVTSKATQYMPLTQGKQRSLFNIVTPQIRMKSDGYDGYPKFRVQLSLPTTTITGSTGFTMLTNCQTTDPLLSCTTFIPSGATLTHEKFFDIGYLGTGSEAYIVSSFGLNLQVIVSGSFGTAANYIITIHLPQFNGVAAPFGHPTALTAFDAKTVYCSCQSTFTVGTSGRGVSMVFENVKFQSLMQNVRSWVSFDFGASSYRQTFFSTSYFTFNFGFIGNTASIFNTRGDFKCIIYQNLNDILTISRSWYSLTLSDLSAVVLKPKDQISSPNTIKYTMKCEGTSVPTAGGVSMALGWKDNSNSFISSVQTAISIAPVTYSSSTVQSFTLEMPFKRFRTQGFKAFYTFKIVLPVAMDQNGRIYINFHSKIMNRLDKQSTVECYTRLNSAIVDSESKFTYCELISSRQLSIWNNQNLGINGILYIDIYNIEQPKLTDISANQKISVTIDIDDSYTNGVNGYQQINDNVIIPMNNVISKITILDTIVDVKYVMMVQVLDINFKMPSSGLFTAASSKIYLQLPASYAQWIKRSDSITTANGDCYLQSTGAGINLATSCIYISKRILKITLLGHTGQLYSIKLKKLKSPSFLPIGKNNQYHFNLFMTSSSSENDIVCYSFAHYSNQLTLMTDASLVDLSWNYYQISQANDLVNLQKIDNQALTIYTGYYSSVVQLRQSTYPANFQSSMLLQLGNYAVGDFLTIENGFQIDLGKSTGYFRIAARSNLSPGLHSLQFIKSGDTDNKYSQIPPLTLVVNTKKCTLLTDSTSYMMPVGGYSIPIIIKGINCIPIDFINIVLGLSSAEVVVDSDVSSVKLDKNVVDGNLYIVLRHTGSLPANSIITGTFTITGTNAAQYNPIPSITITLIDPASYQTLPVATALTSPTLSTNRATFRLQCSQASTIYWGLGIFPSILNTQALDFQARIISKGLGLTSNFTEEDDYYRRVYGVATVSTMQVLTKTLYSLKSKTNYIFKYFCKNQMGLISDSQTINFTSLNYGAYLMKVSITFRNSITFGQYHDLSCSLAYNFRIPSSRVMSQTMTVCNNKAYVFYPNDSSIIVNQADSSGYYIYNFYILPDYSISSDNTNINVRNSLSLHSFSSMIITSTDNYLTLPEMVQMQTEDIQVFSTPTIVIGEPIAGLNSVVITAAITNMNGFVVIGVMNNLFNSTIMTLPTTNNIKKGLFQSTTPLITSKMLYTTQNFNVTFQFSGLMDNNQYTLFYFATSEDPTFLSTSSDVKNVYVKTLQALTVNINWQEKLLISMGFLLLIIFNI